jgi:hypothetical protein
MTTLLIAAICFVAGLITGVVALLAFAFWATRGVGGDSPRVSRGKETV